MATNISSIHSTGDYTTVSAWEAATDIDLVSAGDIEVGEVYLSDSPYDEDALVFAGATVDISNYRILRSTSADKHTGTSGTGARVYSDVGGFGVVLNIQEDFFRINDLEVSSDGASIMYGIFQNAANTDLHISGVLVWNCHYAGIAVNNSGQLYNTAVHSCASYDASFGGILGNSANTDQVMAVNCTVFRDEADDNKSVTGFRYITVKNCLAFHYGGSAGHQDYLNVGTNSANYGASDANGSTTELSNLVAATTFKNISSGNGYDIHLLGVAAVIGSGVVTEPPVSEDVDGNDRSATIPDLGWDEWFMGPGGIDDTDNDLAILYRFGDFDTDELLFNDTKSPAYTGLNTMSISGAFSSFVSKVDGPGDVAPLSSGSMASGSAGELFHLPYSPAQSGNASGIDISSTQSFSMGGWLMNEFAGDFKAFMSKFASTNLRNYELIARTGASAPTAYWSFRLGTGAGATNATISSPFQALPAGWEHVAVTVDGTTSTDNVKLYVSGLMVAQGSVAVSPSTSGAHPSFRLFADSASTSEGVGNAVGSLNGGQLAETFVIHRKLSDEEIYGIAQSGFVTAPAGPAANTGILQSDINDTLKDNVGAQNASTSVVQMTAWNANERADPSGLRHMTSGYHPAWLKIVAIGGGSGLNFGSINQHTASGIKAITFRNATPETAMSNMRFWLMDYSAFAGINGWEVSQHIDSKWLPNLSLPSGSGVVGKSLDSASSVLQSDGGTTISGGTLEGTSIFGESGISQYIYLSFDTNADFTAGNYGPGGFIFKLTTDSV